MASAEASSDDFDSKIVSKTIALPPSTWEAPRAVSYQQFNSRLKEVLRSSPYNLSGHILSVRASLIAGKFCKAFPLLLMADTLTSYEVSRILNDELDLRNKFGKYSQIVKAALNWQLQVEVSATHTKPSLDELPAIPWYKVMNVMLASYNKGTDKVSPDLIVFERLFGPWLELGTHLKPEVVAAIYNRDASFAAALLRNSRECILYWRQLVKIIDQILDQHQRT